VLTRALHRRAGQASGLADQAVIRRTEQSAQREGTAQPAAAQNAIKEWKMPAITPDKEDTP